FLDPIEKSGLLAGVLFPADGWANATATIPIAPGVRFTGGIPMTLASGMVPTNSFGVAAPLPATGLAAPDLGLSLRAIDLLFADGLDWDRWADGPAAWLAGDNEPE